MTPSRHAEHRHLIKIEFTGNKFVYSDPDNNVPAAMLTVRRGDVIRWHCAHGNYSILFKKDSPFAEVGYHGRKGEHTKEALVTGDSGSYHYAVSIVPDEGAPAVDDPQIIVGD